MSAGDVVLGIGAGVRTGHVCDRLWRDGVRGQAPGRSGDGERVDAVALDDGGSDDSTCKEFIEKVNAPWR